MTKICKLLGLTALVEVHHEREMDCVLGIEGIELIGINNRDLGTFKVDIANTKKLLEGECGERILEKGIIVVGESGLFTPADIAYVQELTPSSNDSFTNASSPLYMCVCSGLLSFFFFFHLLNRYWWVGRLLSRMTQVRQ